MDDRRTFALRKVTRRGNPAGWVLAGLVAGIVLYLFNPVQSQFYPVCLFHELTGWHCPGCGSLRALHALAHGDLRAALGFNPLLILILPCLGGLWLRRILRGSQTLGLEWVKPFWVWMMLGLVLAFGLLRNVPLAPFVYLAP